MQFAAASPTNSTVASSSSSSSFPSRIPPAGAARPPLRASLSLHFVSSSVLFFSHCSKRSQPPAPRGERRWRRTHLAASFSSGNIRLDNDDDNYGGSSSRGIPGRLGVDELLAVAELLCVAPPAICSIGFLVSFAFPGAFKRFQLSLGSRAFAAQYFMLVAAVALGSLIRWWQWRRVFRVKDNSRNIDLIGRIEKLEEDLRSSATIVRVLSRQLEKLGIRFRVTRKALKEPIAETAALAQKNSEATRALALQEDILEKELGEIQKVLLAMQEQQQKQLELILAIGKAGRLLDNKKDSLLEPNSYGTGTSAPEKKETEELKIQ